MPPREENGNLQLIGDGVSTINFDFPLSYFDHSVVDDPHDPGPLSAIPVNKEKVEVTIQQLKSGNWQLKIAWQVFGVKTLYWTVRA